MSANARKVTEVLDDKGEVVQSTYAAPRITVSYERVNTQGLPQYEKESAFCSKQVDVDLDADGSANATAIAETFALVKGAVLQQLGLKSKVDDDGIVREVIEILGGSVVSETPRGGGQRRSTGNAKGSSRSQADLWADLSENPQKWFDNRDSKTKPTQPDFRRKGTGEGLWLTNKDGSNNAETYGATLP